jgi:hypothetical protein
MASTTESLKRAREDMDSAQPAPGKVHVASMMIRGDWADLPPGATRVNVTSMQGLKHPHRADFSPMALTNGTYEGYACFENWWQSGKRYVDSEGQPIPEQLESRIAKWWRKQTKGKRRCPLAKGLTVSHAEWNGRKYAYIESRKEVYVPKYEDMVCGTRSLAQCTMARLKGIDQAVYDFDGPRNPNGTPTCEEVSVEMLRKYINDPKYPFGHGFVVAALLCGIFSCEYTM